MTANKFLDLLIVLTVTAFFFTLYYYYFGTSPQEEEIISIKEESLPQLGLSSKGNLGFCQGILCWDGGLNLGP